MSGFEPELQASKARVLTVRRQRRAYRAPIPCSQYRAPRNPAGIETRSVKAVLTVWPGLCTNSGIRTREAEASDLKSDPFDRSGMLVCARFISKIKFWLRIAV